MYCTKCGKEYHNNVNFCSLCGSSLKEDHYLQKNRNQKITSKTFNAPGLLFPDPVALASNMNQWFTNSSTVSYVKMNLQIYRGIVKYITILYSESDKPMPYLFGIDVIKLGFFEMISAPEADKYINNWIATHSEVKVVTQRVVTYNSVPSQIWILYKYYENREVV